MTGQRSAPNTRLTEYTIILLIVYYAYFSTAFVVYVERSSYFVYKYLIHTGIDIEESTNRMFIVLTSLTLFRVLGSVVTRVMIV